MIYSPGLAETLNAGLECCRKGNWAEGLRYLGSIAERAEWTPELPGLFYSYLGYGVAVREQRIDEGLKLCRHAIKLEFYQVENYLNLARTCLLAQDRAGAVRAVRAGLKVDSHPALLRLQEELGIRSSPVLPFLSRSNFLNQLLGRIRHAFEGRPPTPPVLPSPRERRERGKEESQARIPLPPLGD